MRSTYSICFQTGCSYPWIWLDSDIYKSDRYKCVFEFALIYHGKRYTKYHYNPY